MSKLRSVSTAFWSDPLIEELTPNEKLLFLYLITNEKTNMLGIYESSNRKIAFETGLKITDIETLLNRLEELGRIKRIGNWVLLCNFMKHQNYNPNMKKSALNIYNSLPKELNFNKIEFDDTNALEAFETLLNHLGMVRKIEYEVEYEREEENKYEDEEKPKQKKPKDEKPKDENHLLVDWLNKNCPNVQKLQNPITNEQAIKIVNEFDKDKIIDIFNSMENYKQLKQKYTNAYLTFRNWAKNDFGNKGAKPQEQSTENRRYYQLVWFGGASEKHWLTEEELKNFRPKPLSYHDLTEYHKPKQA